MIHATPHVLIAVAHIGLDGVCSVIYLNVSLPPDSQTLCIAFTCLQWKILTFSFNVQLAGTVITWGKILRLFRTFAYFHHNGILPSLLP